MADFKNTLQDYPMLANPALDEMQSVADQPMQPIQAPPQPGQLQPIRQAPAAPAPLPRFQPNQMRQRQEQGLMASLQPHPSPTGFWGKTKSILGDIGNTTGTIILGNNVMSGIPGSNQSNTLKQNATSGQLRELEQEDAGDRQQFDTEQATANKQPLVAAQTREANANADAKENAPDKAVTLQQMHANAVNKAINEGRDPSTDPTVNHLADAITGLQKESQPKTFEPKTIEKVGPDGKTHIYSNTAKNTGMFDQDQGIAGAKPPAVRVDNGAHEFAENERGRGLLDKAEGAYRTAQQGANGLRSMVDNASSGDKMSARMLPLEGALEITTSQGVHRINRTEVDQYAGGGNAFDRLAGILKGGVTGVPFTQEILNSMKHLADIQEKGAYDNYKGAYDSTTRRYHLSDEKALPVPGGNQPQGGGGQPMVQQSPSTGQFRHSLDGGKTWQPGKPQQ